MKKNYLTPLCDVLAWGKTDIVLASGEDPTGNGWFDSGSGDYGDDWIWGDK